MGTIAEKLTYLNGTKQALKESINNLGGDITSETTFREYAQELDNIYDNLPKTTGEGTNLSLTTLKGKMNTTLKGDTEQDGTPTPDTPIDIEVVTGTQTITISNSDNTETQTQTISLGDIELCKIGNYQDYLYKSGDKWYKKEYIGKVVFTGASSETWSYSVNDAFFYTNTILNIAKPTDSFYCNYFESVPPTSVTPVNMRSGTIKFQTNSIATLFLKYTDINTLANFKTWLSTHNTEVRYVLATPQDILITNETLIEQLDNLEKMYSYNGVTNINCSGNLSAILSVSALKGES